MIDKTIKNIKKILCKVLEGLLTAKISTKKKKEILYKVLEGILTAKIANTKFLFIYLYFVFPIYKKAKYKNGCYYQRNMKIVV